MRKKENKERRKRREGAPGLAPEQAERRHFLQRKRMFEHDQRMDRQLASAAPMMKERA